MTKNLINFIKFLELNKGLTTDGAQSAGPSLTLQAIGKGHITRRYRRAVTLHALLAVGRRQCLRRAPCGCLATCEGCALRCTARRPRHQPCPGRLFSARRCSRARPRVVTTHPHRPGGLRAAPVHAMMVTTTLVYPLPAAPAPATASSRSRRGTPTRAGGSHATVPR